MAFQASSAASVRVANVTPEVASPDQATRVALTLRGLKTLRDNPVDGQLVVTGGAAPVARAVTITPAAQPIADWPMWILIGASGFGVLLVLSIVARALVKHEVRRLGGRAPGPKWSFNSWGIKDAHRRLEPLSAEANIEVRQHDVASSHTILRFDQQMLLTIHLYGTPGFQAPLLHLRRERDYGIFDQLVGHIEDLWKSATALTTAPAGQQAPGAARDDLDDLDYTWRPAP